MCRRRASCGERARLKPVWSEARRNDSADRTMDTQDFLPLGSGMGPRKRPRGGGNVLGARRMCTGAQTYFVLVTGLSRLASNVDV
ncbi:hypothetical protein C0Q70_03832 [Pomacea canaliculata]|uniref:Uncharacterized protein n=1 Tax=Pomacea canaliculata TaxID=400727 RepID=A0A2T7PTU3_POMCA|nr:hypothetical protein C0Q70_03832 [Pomacea canaliculata]